MQEKYEALKTACIDGNIAQVKKIINKMPKKDVNALVNTKGKFNFTLLYWAIGTNTSGNSESNVKKLAIVEFLIECGADVNAQTEDDEASLLHWVVKWSKDPNLIQVLIKKGARTDLKNKEGLTPKEYAIKQGYDEMVGVLCRKVPNFPEHPYNPLPV